jgi:hypothetical protein
MLESGRECDDFVILTIDSFFFWMILFVFQKYFTVELFFR